MATGSQPNSVLYGVYEEYVGEARTKPEVYGYWVLLLGLVLSVAGVVVLLLDQAVALGISTVRIRELVVALGATGGVFLLLGAVLQLPIRRRAVWVAVLGSLVSLASVGGFVSIYPAAWRVGTRTTLGVVVGYAGGIAIVALVAALVPLLTGRRSLLLAEESAEKLAWIRKEEDETEERVSAVLLGEATRDGLFAVFPSDQGWQWWFVEQTAVADGVQEYETQTEAEEALEGVRPKVANASLIEVNHAAFRLYEGDVGGVRWSLVDDAGAVVADSDGSYADRTKAEDAINLLKERGPDAALLDTDGGAFELYADGEAWRWRLVGENRSELAAAPEGYDDRDDAERAMAAVRSRATAAPLMDVEHVGFELRETEDEWYWRLVDDDDAVIAESTERFATRRDAQASVHRIAEGAIDAPFLEAATPGYEVFEGDDGGWRWRLIDDADEPVAVSPDPVPSAESGRSVVGRVKDVVDDATVLDLDDAEFEVFPEGETWAWRLVTEDRETIARSPASATCESADAATAAVDRVRDQLAAAERIEFETAAFHLYEADEGAWNWRLIDSDGSVISDSGQEHASREDAAASMNTLKQHAPDADLVEIETAALELYEAEDQWHWRLVDETGETLATSPGRHETADDAHEAMDTLELLAPEAGTREMVDAAFQLYVGDGESGRWRWRLIHPDGNVVARSASGFAAREEAEAAAESVTEYAGDATVHTFSDVAVRFTVESGTAADADGDADGDGESAEIWRWEVLDREREALAVGTGTFADRDAVADVARLVRDHAGAASVFEVDPAAFRLIEREDGWRWELVDPERTVLAVGTRTHDSREKAEVALSRVRELATEAEPLDFDTAAFEIVEDQGSWRWRFVDTAGNTIARSSVAYGSRSAAGDALAAVRERLRTASVLDIESPAFELHREDDEWYWRLVDVDGTTVAQSMRTYPTRRAAREALAGLREFGGDAATEVAT